MLGVARRRPEAAGAVGRDGKRQGAAGAGPNRGAGGGQRPLKLLPRPQVSSAQGQRCLPPAHSVAVPLEPWSSLEPQRIPPTETLPGPRPGDGIG